MHMSKFVSSQHLPNKSHVFSSFPYSNRQFWTIYTHYPPPLEAFKQTSLAPEIAFLHEGFQKKYPAGNRHISYRGTVDGSESGVHQLRLVVYPIIYKVLCIPGVGFLPSTVFLKKTFLFPRWGDVSWQEGTPLMDRGLLENPLTARFTEKNADLLRVKAALKKHLPVPYHWPLATCIPTISTTQL